MKVLAIYWVVTFFFMLIGQAFSGDWDQILIRSAFLASLLAPAFWAKAHWAPVFYLKRQKRKTKGRKP